MPNGYTAPIYEGEEITLRDFLVRCSRGFGVHVTMRDDPLDKEPPKAYEPDIKRYDESIAKAHEELAEVQQWTEDEAAKAAEVDYQERRKAHEESVANRQAMRNRYDDMIEQVQGWSPHPELQDMKDGILGWLHESRRFDCGSDYDEPLRLTGEAFKEQRIESLRKNIEWDEKFRREELERVASRNAYLKKFWESLPDA